MKGDTFEWFFRKKLAQKIVEPPIYTDQLQS